MPDTAPASPTPTGEEIGQVVSYFSVPGAAIIKVAQGTLQVGDKIWIRGHTTDLTETIASMQVDREPISAAKAGDEVGIKVSGRVRRHDRVYKIA